MLSTEIKTRRILHGPKPPLALPYRPRDTGRAVAALIALAGVLGGLAVLL